MNTITLATNKIDAYLKIRKQLFLLNTRIFEMTSKSDQQIAAELLGIFEDNEIVIEEEVDYERFVDFITHEYLNETRKTYVQQLLESENNLTDEEHTFLIAKQKAHAIFYEITAVNRAENSITLRSLFERDKAPVTIIDIGLSNSAKPNHGLIFTRIINLPEFNVISGASNIFLKRNYEKISKFYSRQYKKLPDRLTRDEKRYIAMFLTNHVHGEKIITKSPQAIKNAQTQAEAKVQP